MIVDHNLSLIAYFFNGRYCFLFQCKPREWKSWQWVDKQLVNQNQYGLRQKLQWRFWWSRMAATRATRLTERIQRPEIYYFWAGTGRNEGDGEVMSCDWHLHDAFCFWNLRGNGVAVMRFTTCADVWYIGRELNFVCFSWFSQDCLDELELESAEDEAGSRSDGGSSISKDDFVDTWRFVAYTNIVP